MPDEATEPVSAPLVGDRLAALDRLRRRERLLRAGWLWLTGTVPIEGKDTPVCLPLLTTTIELGRRGLVANHVRPVGDVYSHLTELGGDREQVDELASAPELGGGLLRPDMTPAEIETLEPLTRWAQAGAAAVGLTIDEWVTPQADARAYRGKSGLFAVPGVALFVDPGSRTIGRSQLLRRWTRRDDVAGTAFAHVYGTPSPSTGEADAKEAPTGAGGSAEPSAPYDDVGDYVEVPWAPSMHPTRPLGADQVDIVAASRHASVLTVTGPPGTGKTHTLCEVALDAIARHESVLIGANSDYAVGVLARYFDDGGGPTPVLFGGSDLAANLSEQLVDMTADSGRADLGSAETAMAAARKGYLDQWARIAELLHLEHRAERLGRDPALRIDLDERLDAFPGGTQRLTWAVETLRSLPSRHPIAAWFTRRKLRSKVRPYPIDQIGELMLHHRARRLLADGGVELEPSADELFRLEQDYLSANARWLTGLGAERLRGNRAGRRVVQQVASASRAGRQRRRQILADIDGDRLADAAPLWLGTVTDIDDVLPDRPGMFDLVILDEASQMDQLAAAGALLRARRAVICGDPRQLRHLSFVADADITRVNDLHPGPARIDIRRDSVFDHALGVGEARPLTVHYRSWPHLIDFSAKRFYPERLLLATRTPQSDATDLIDVRRLEPSGATAGADRSQRTNDQEIEQRRIEVGTVHAFQGAEFDLVIASWVLSDADSSQSWRFVNNPNLFNVMVTRARRRMVVVTSYPDPPGLAGDYLEHAAHGGRERPGEPPAGWVAQVAAALTDAGLHPITDYRVATFDVDIALRDGDQPTALVCGLHPGGADVHLRREMKLRRMGWRVIDVFEGRWSEHLGRFAVELATERD